MQFPYKISAIVRYHLHNKYSACILSVECIEKRIVSTPYAISKCAMLVFLQAKGHRWRLNFVFSFLALSEMD